MNWQTLLAPVIIAVVPLIVVGVKKVIPPQWSVLFPLIATVLGAAADTVSQLATGTSYGPAWGAALGLAGVGLREIVDQLRKLKEGP